jgi:hypothetical protein
MSIDLDSAGNAHFAYGGGNDFRYARKLLSTFLPLVRR